MSGLLGSGFDDWKFSPPLPPWPPPSLVAPQYIPAPNDNTAEVKAAEERQRKALALARGRQSTILTGGRGIEETATVGRKTLLGE